ncbi:MAG: hypothetical protein ABJP45_03445 [Cyclobacteriaceae bacterium]
MKKIIILLSIVFFTSCQEDEVTPEKGSLEKAQLEIDQLMSSYDFTNSEGISALKMEDLRSIRENVFSILEKNDFKQDYSGDLEMLKKLVTTNSTSGRIAGCSNWVFHLEGNGILGAGESVVYWECDGYVSNAWWVDGEKIGENRWPLES